MTQPAMQLSLEANQCPTGTQQPATAHGVTELILTRHSPDKAMVLLPMISHLSRTASRWITWVVDSKVDKQLLESYGVDTSKLRLIYASAGKESRWLVWEALRAGTSECVIATPGRLSEEELGHLEAAAKQGASHGLFINYK